MIDSVSPAEHKLKQSSFFSTTAFDSREFASTVLWLEDQKIRHFTIEDRENLRNIDEPEVWKRAYADYKTHLGVPDMPTATEELIWILGEAIELEYSDDEDTYKAFTAEKFAESKVLVEPTLNAKNPLTSMDTSSAEFDTGVRELARRLNIPHHPDPVVVLEAAARIAERFLGKSEVRPKDEHRSSNMAYSIKDAEKYAFPEKNVDEAANILRLLQIHSVRNLQTVINETIVAVQEITANPKTDTKLGKVGF